MFTDSDCAMATKAGQGVSSVYTSSFTNMCSVGVFAVSALGGPGPISTRQPGAPKCRPVRAVAITIRRAHGQHRRFT